MFHFIWKKRHHLCFPVWKTLFESVLGVLVVRVSPKSGLIAGAHKRRAADLADERHRFLRGHLLVGASSLLLLLQLFLVALPLNH